MKKILQFSFLIFALLLCFDTDLYGQRKGKKKKKKSKTSKVDDYFDESGGFKHRLWYGASIGNPSFFNGTFSFSLSPMVAYKVIENLSVGPIVKLDYFFQRIGNGTNRIRYEALDYSIGAFSRYKVLNSIFAHVEYESTSFQLIDYDDFGQVQVLDNKVLTRREWEPYFYVGGGYSSGGGLWGYEIFVLYNVMDNANKQRIPWDLRFGFTYNF